MLLKKRCVCVCVQVTAQALYPPELELQEVGSCLTRCWQLNSGPPRAVSAVSHRTRLFFEAGYPPALYAAGDEVEFMTLLPPPPEC